MAHKLYSTSKVLTIALPLRRDAVWDGLAVGEEGELDDNDAWWRQLQAW